MMCVGLSPAHIADAQARIGRHPTLGVRTSLEHVSNMLPQRSRVGHYAAPRTIRATAMESSKPAGRVASLPVPTSAQETVEQATQTVLRAYNEGVLRHRVQFLLPLIGATELDDWPGGIRQQFKAAAPMVEGMLKTLKQEYSLTGPISTSILDPGDAVGAWTGANLAAVLFPTAETLSSVRSIAEARPEGLTMLVNPQWQAGQLVSDFGWGPWRARNEELVGSFQETYTFKQLRIQGEDVRVLYAFPGRWQVHVAEDDGSLPLVWTGDEMLPYTELEALLRKRPGSKAAMGWAQRLQREIEFNMKG